MLTLNLKIRCLYRKACLQEKREFVCNFPKEGEGESARERPTFWRQAHISEACIFFFCSKNRTLIFSSLQLWVPKGTQEKKDFQLSDPSVNNNNNNNTNNNNNNKKKKHLLLSSRRRRRRRRLSLFREPTEFLQRPEFTVTGATLRALPSS